MSPTTQKYINIYTEASPNPNSLKFACSEMLVAEGADFDYPNVEAAQGGSALAVGLFETFPFVDRVFIMNNFVTVTRKDDAQDWYEVAPQVKQYIKEWLEASKPVITTETIKAYETSANADEPEDIRKIKAILDEYVRPAVEGDGGAINFHSYEDGIVKVELRGSCSGCPSSTVTLKNGIENLLQRLMPEIKAVIAEGV